MPSLFLHSPPSSLPSPTLFSSSRGILDFNNEVSKVEAWIRDKELLVSQGDLGKDYEHCMELQRKLEDAGSGATRGVDDERIEQIFQMAAKLCSEAGSEAPAVEAKRAEIGSKYSALQQDIQVKLQLCLCPVLTPPPPGVQEQAGRGGGHARLPEGHGRHLGQDQGEDPPAGLIGPRQGP